jgi:hypothetical protein
MSWLRKWFCRKRVLLLRVSVLLALGAPFVAWVTTVAFGLDPQVVLGSIAAALFAMWRPYRDSWLRPACQIRSSEQCA